MLLCSPLSHGSNHSLPHRTDWRCFVSVTLGEGGSDTRSVLNKCQSLLASVALCLLKAQLYSQGDCNAYLVLMKGEWRSIMAQLSQVALSRCVTSLCLDFLLQEMSPTIHSQGEAGGGVSTWIGPQLSGLHSFSSHITPCSVLQPSTRVPARRSLPRPFFADPSSNVSCLGQAAAAHGHPLHG